MSRGPRLVLLGKQGAGKGTQAARLAERYGIEHVSTGDLFRAAAAAGTPAGREAEQYMNTGDLVPDDLTLRIVEERFAENGLVDQGFVLDGFPRTLPQAEPESDWTCDVCGGRVVQRDDDTEDAVMRRLELYEEETVPIIDFYRKVGKLVVVDGTGDGDDVFARLVEQVDQRLKQLQT